MGVPVKAELAEDVLQSAFGFGQTDLRLDGFATVKGMAGAIEAEALHGHGNGAIALAHGNGELQDAVQVIEGVFQIGRGQEGAGVALAERFGDAGGGDKLDITFQFGDGSGGGNGMELKAGEIIFHLPGRQLAGEAVTDTDAALALGLLDQCIDGGGDFFDEIPPWSAWRCSPCHPFPCLIRV